MTTFAKSQTPFGRPAFSWTNLILTSQNGKKDITRKKKLQREENKILKRPLRKSQLTIVIIL
jgi:hypothetical protein